MIPALVFLTLPVSLIPSCIASMKYVFPLSLSWNTIWSAMVTNVSSRPKRLLLISFFSIFFAYDCVQDHLCASDVPSLLQRVLSRISASWVGERYLLSTKETERLTSKMSSKASAINPAPDSFTFYVERPMWHRDYISCLFDMAELVSSSWNQW